VDHFDSCEVLAEASRDAHLMASCLLNRAEVLLAMARTEQATRGVRGAWIRRARRALHAADVHRMIALCDRADGHLGQAETQLKWRGSWRG
jgi:hypothetical protein